MRRIFDVVLNPAAGAGLAEALVADLIKPLLEAPPPYPERSEYDEPPLIKIHRTNREGDGIRIGHQIISDYRSGSSESGYPNVILVGGDGTTHEFLNGFYTIPLTDSAYPTINLAIVPAGTANALFSSMYPKLWTQEAQQVAASAMSVDLLPEDVRRIMLKSVHALVSSAKSRLLPLMLNEINTSGEVKTLLSHLVTSHALHAAILHDADTPEMRAKHAGIERFKAAAQLNATRWTHGQLSLHPLPSSWGAAVLRYLPVHKTFSPVSREEVQLEGPFLYLNAMTTDRLEAAFVPAPLSSAFRQDGILPHAIDVVAIRPKRDQTLKGGEQEAAVQFAKERLGEITAGMYDGGKHVDLSYEGGDPVVEYYRCLGYTFVPKKGGEEKARLVCTDGFISFADSVKVTRWEANGTQRPPLVAL